MTWFYLFTVSLLLHVFVFTEEYADKKEPLHVSFLVLHSSSQFQAKLHVYKESQTVKRHCSESLARSGSCSLIRGTFSEQVRQGPV